MQRLELDVERETAARTTDVTFRFPPNWTIICFFISIAGLHWYMAISALMKGRFDAFMSLVLGPTFTIVALISWRIKKEITFMSAARRLRIRTGLKRLNYQRFARFNAVRSVRLTLLHPSEPRAATIELVLDREVIELPPTDLPRQEALALAMTLNVPLTKVYSDSYGPAAERLDHLPPE